MSTFIIIALWHAVTSMAAARNSLDVLAKLQGIKEKSRASITDSCVVAESKRFSDMPFWKQPLNTWIILWKFMGTMDPSIKLRALVHLWVTAMPVTALLYSSVPIFVIWRRVQRHIGGRHE